ncbi:MAG: LytTR family DNA-binding domain-containing protein [Ligilactobacillus sp.]|nr:LytTR family DNA-binding domain-containing protein [Ligilactobacillus sp.]
MLNIVIVEDDLVQRMELVSFIKKYVAFEDLDAEVVLDTDSSQNTLDFTARNDSKDFLFFLDIGLASNKLAGIQLAKELRTKFPHADIVFLTSHVDLSLLALRNRIASLDYIGKDMNEKDIQNSIRKDIKLALNNLQYVRKRETFTYKHRNKFLNIPLDDIYYFESDSTGYNPTILYGKNRAISVPYTLKSIEKAHPRLFRCHRSYLVNLENIVSYNYTERKIYFDIEEKISCPVSIRKISALIQLLKK